MKRLFVALDLPEAIRTRLGWLAGGIPGARWTPPEALHLTLRFIGEVEDGLAGDIAAALVQVNAPGFSLTLDGVGHFGGARGARALWAGVAAAPALHLLQHRVEAAVVRAGVAHDTRKYTPHVTLARLAGANLTRVGRFIAENNLFRAGPFAVDAFTLYRSLLGSGGPVYEALARYDLGAAFDRGMSH
jgi:2'-5' RNA ligase